MSAAPRPVPVLLTVRELNIGGVERDVAKIALHLDRSRFTPHVAAYFAHGFRYDELRAGGVPVLDLQVRSVLRPAAIGHALRLRRYLKQHRIQVVHSYDPSGIFCSAVAQASGVPVVITSQLSYRELDDPRTRSLLRLSDRFADAILVNCEAIRRHLVDDEGIAAGRVELCYNGVDTSQFFPAEVPRPPEVADASLVIGTLCALRKEKGLGVLQEAFARVLALRAGMKLLIVGSGVELDRLRENAVRLGIAGASVFHPATADVPKWMRAIDIFVLPSLSEAFSNALLEAMACGCAAVGSRVGGTPELLGANGERGLLFERANAAGLADRLSELIGDDALRKRLGESAAAFARDKLTIQIAAETTGAMYDRLLLAADPDR